MNANEKKNQKSDTLNTKASKCYNLIGKRFFLQLTFSPLNACDLVGSVSVYWLLLLLFGGSGVAGIHDERVSCAMSR